ncbi:MAG: hypothetical protein IKU16_09495 [Muribaculaceae bacterium]|nr:hypothetical protein [Muribaculaceae bacterium]MBR4887485.1 hypothetical protein [Muribaculaceae bacterium]
MKEFYQVRLWCSDDSCEEFWSYKDLSPVYSDIKDAETFLSQYEGKTSSEIEKMCDVVSVRNNRPQIHIIEVSTKEESTPENIILKAYKWIENNASDYVVTCYDRGQIDLDSLLSDFLKAMNL